MYTCAYQPGVFCPLLSETLTMSTNIWDVSQLGDGEEQAVDLIARDTADTL